MSGREENRGEAGEFKYKGYLIDITTSYDDEGKEFWSGDIVDVAPGARWDQGLYDYPTKGALIKALRANINQALATAKSRGTYDIGAGGMPQYPPVPASSHLLNNPGTPPLSASALVGKLKF